MPTQTRTIPLPVIAENDRNQLRFARDLLEHPGLTARIAAAVGRPIEAGLAHLPRGFSLVVHSVTQRALRCALKVAVASLDLRHQDLGQPSADNHHRMLGGAFGAMSGLFGLPGLAVELPFTTTLMLRSIADIAQSESHDPGEPGIQLDCLQVFALGGGGKADDAANNGYWVVRAALSKAFADAAAEAAARGLTGGAATPLVRFISAVASRFGVIVTEQAAAKAIPLIGSAAGATINYLFMGHFIVRRLETQYGREKIRRLYEAPGL